MDSKNQTAAMGILLTISAAHFLNDLLQSVIPASLPVLKEANALTFAEVGLITLTVQITSSLLQPFVGAVSDRHPMPAALPCGMLLSAVHTEHGEEKLHLIMVDDAIPAGAKLC